MVPDATLPSEEPGTLDAAAGLARDWFLSDLPHGPASEEAGGRGSRTPAKGLGVQGSVG